MAKGTATPTLVKVMVPLNMSITQPNLESKVRLAKKGMLDLRIPKEHPEIPGLETALERRLFPQLPLACLSRTESDPRSQTF